MNKLNIENIVKEKLSDFEYNSVNSDWDNFEKKLPKKKISHTKYYIAAASIIIVALLSIPFLNTQKQEIAIVKKVNLKEENTETNNKIKSNKTTKNNKAKKSSKQITKKEVEIEKIKIINEINDTTIKEVKTVTNEFIEEKSLSQENIITDTYKPISNFKLSNNKGCAPLKISVMAYDNNPNTIYFWEFEDGTTSSSNVTFRTFTKSGIYKITLTTTNKNNQKTSSFDTTITVYETPKADFTYSIFDESYSFEGTNCEKQIWKFGDNSFSNEMNPEHIYSRIGETVVSFTAINEYGCKSAHSKTINIEPIFQIANAFSPNNDGNNDEFGPIFENTENFKYYLYIYNAYGDLIFKSQQTNQNWNGLISNSNDIAKKGVYLWKLIISDKYDNKLNKKGKLTIK